MWTSRLLHEDIISLFNVSRLAAEFGPSLSRPPSPSTLLAMQLLVPGPSSCFSWHLISSPAVLTQHIWTCVPQGDCCLKCYVLPKACSCLGSAENGLLLTLLNHSEAILLENSDFVKYCQILKIYLTTTKKNVIESKITTLMREW